MYNINIDSNLTDFITNQSTADNVTPEVWIQRKAEATIKRLMKDQAIETINTSKIDDLPTFFDAVNSVKETITVRDYVEPSEEIIQ